MTETVDLVQRALDALALRPLRNTLGKAAQVLVDNGIISLAANSGRIVVAPGQSISSAWGNTVFDQSVICFASAADRDAQWPAPHAGAVCYTLDQRRVHVHDGTTWLVWYTAYATERATASAQRTDIASRAWGNCLLAASTKGNWTTAAGLITATRAGTIWVGIFVTYNDAGGAISMLGFKHNGLDVGGGAGVNLGGGALQLRGSYAVPVAVGDTIGVQIYNMVGASAAFLTTSEITFQG